MTNPAAGMPCPVCKVALVMSERQGVEIDYCPQCRGVWLDRGELDKILERSAQDAPTAGGAPVPPQSPPRGPGPFERERAPYRDDDAYYDDDDGRQRGGRRRSFFEDLFD